jgi:arylformamidase
MSQWLDISIPMNNNLPPWPGDTAFHRDIVSEIGVGGAQYNVSVLSMSSHAGTHMDAPKHFVAGGAGIDMVSPELLVGPAYVLDLSGRSTAGHIGVEELQGRIPAGTLRLLVKTGNSSLLGDGMFHEDYTALTLQAVEYVVKAGIRLLGFDYYSFAPFEAPVEAHRALLNVHGTAAIENVDLSQAREGWYDLICLPLKIEGGDGSPARALIRKREG